MVFIVNYATAPSLTHTHSTKHKVQYVFHPLAREKEKVYLLICCCLKYSLTIAQVGLQPAAILLP